MSITVRARESGSELCGFCRDDLDEESSGCPVCEARYHTDCWEEELEQRCATIGCENQKPVQGVRRVVLIQRRLRRRRRRRLLRARRSSSTDVSIRALVIGISAALTGLVASIVWELPLMHALGAGVVATGLLLVFLTGGVLAREGLRDLGDELRARRER